MKLYIKEKVVSWGDKFTVKDAYGEDKYIVEGEVFSWGKKLLSSRRSGASFPDSMYFVVTGRWRKSRRNLPSCFPDTLLRVLVGRSMAASWPMIIRSPKTVETLYLSARNG